MLAHESGPPSLPSYNDDAGSPADVPSAANVSTTDVSMEDVFPLAAEFPSLISHDDDIATMDPAPFDEPCGITQCVSNLFLR